MKHVLAVFGTRAEAVKIAPVLAALRSRDDVLRVTACLTSHQREMLERVLTLFGIVPEIDLDLVRPGQGLSDLAAAVLQRVDDVLAERQPDAVLVLGDGTTALAASLAAFHRRIPVAHVEAGVRSGRLDAPFPEEMNRVVVGRLASLHFAPTPLARENLLREGVDERAVAVTGNTAIDAVLHARGRLAAHREAALAPVGDAKRVVLVVLHRREAQGKPFADLCVALQGLAAARPQVAFACPVALSPQAKEAARERATAPNVVFLEPQDYGSLVALLDRCELVMTDSAGVQEEASALGRPVVVLREVTDRPELLAAGAGVLAGAQPERIVEEAGRLLDDPALRAAMGRPRSLFGDGRAAVRIVARLAGEAVRDWVPSDDPPLGTR